MKEIKWMEIANPPTSYFQPSESVFPQFPICDTPLNCQTMPNGRSVCPFSTGLQLYHDLFVRIWIVDSPGGGNMNVFSQKSVQSSPAPTAQHCALWDGSLV